MTESTAKLVHLSQQGAFSRLADPAWLDPLDTRHSARTGGRWNGTGHAALYLNKGERMARLQAEHKLAGQPYGIEDLDPAEQHDLIEVTVDPVDVLDCVSPGGVASTGLPASYPRAADGSSVEHAACRAVALRARTEGLDGVLCRSAVPGANETDAELAVFDPPAASRVTLIARRPFGDWYLGIATN